MSMKGASFEKLAVISTSHLPKKECVAVEEAVSSNWLTGMERLEGFMIYTNQWDDLVCERHPNLSSLLKMAQQEGVEWLMFDRDGPQLEDESVPTFDW